MSINDWYHITTSPDRSWHSLSPINKIPALLAGFASRSPKTWLGTQQPGDHYVLRIIAPTVERNYYHGVRYLS